MKETNSNNEEIMSDSEIIEIINLILISELKQKGINFNDKISLRANSYITGNVNDIIFVICEIIFKLIKISEDEASITFTLTEDETDWYFIVESSEIKKVNNNDLYLFKNIVLSIKNANLVKEDNSVKILLKK